MSATKAMRDRLFDPDKGGVISGAARSKRWSKFLETFPDIEGYRVLDLGGRPDYWTSAQVQPRHVTCVNLQVGIESRVDWIDYVLDDAGSVDLGEFDLVVSNSLLEHVGGHASRRRVADVIHASAPRHWVQTPYRYFPIEPHWLFPGMQWMPHRARVEISRRWPLGHVQTATREAAEDRVNEIDLLGIDQMRNLFPTSTIWFERFGGLVKSLVAIKTT